ncbi:RNase adapter RapZ [Microbacterium betulae]|uniref:ATP-dependent Clp protease proteolytic subunit n=1 Tax=Microbacterium betulae TaxID=2981139 RepID=A0AA97FJ01_9MICO|nr:head maturation protease, ClpP-related [Microbacterium sp. AB]WOF23833.1 RNase adapter RapZ [Microbacterium sp. AB]
MSVRVQTFGYSFRDAPDTDVVADVRDIPGIVVNGHEDSNGLDPDVQDSVMGSTRAQEWRDELVAEATERDGDASLAIGCSQGRHRSVALAEVVAAALREDGHVVTTDHLDIDASPADTAAHRPGGRMGKHENRYWGDRTPPKTKAEFFNAVTTPVTGEAGVEVATIRMYGPIDSYGGWWGISTSDIGEVLDQLPDSVETIILRLNSPGGEVSEAVAILNMLRAHKASIVAVVDGLAASAASVIAVGCDETVMSPGTQMMIHSPWSFAMGNATDLRKVASTLDSFEATIVEIYAGKAGEKDWAALLAEETWLPAKDAVELGLADRVAVIPDAGETATVGDDIDDDEDLVEDVAHLRVAATLTPAASAPGDPHTGKETAVAFSTDQLNTMRASLGLADDADETAILAAVAARRAPAVPEGVEMIDATALDELRAQARAGVEAREQQITEQRERLVDGAIAKGKFAAARRDHFLALHKADPEGTTAIINSLAENTIPVAELGFDADGETVKASEDVAYAAAASRLGITIGA